MSGQETTTGAAEMAEFGAALRCDDPGIVERWRVWHEAYLTSLSDAIEAAKSLGAESLVGVAGFDGEWHGLTGLTWVDPAPAGWSWVARRKAMRPVRGKDGDAARQWLSDHKIARGSTWWLVQTTGLPWYASSMRDDGNGHSYFARVRCIDDTLWAHYSGGELDRIGADWTRVPLSDFMAAVERSADIAPSVVS